MSSGDVVVAAQRGLKVVKEGFPSGQRALCPGSGAVGRWMRDAWDRTSCSSAGHCFLFLFHVSVRNSG